jgi:thioesterase domain-containing protein/aryl carrier-like protein
VPEGAAGELYLAGAGLARCYAGQPGVTAERFVSNPYGEPGSRLLRTGDLVRRDEEGDLRYLARADRSQALIGGVRIGLAEVADAVSRHPAVRDAAVIEHEEQLVAYAEPEPGSPVDAEALAAFVSGLLPGRTVPSAFVVLDELPRSADGTVDTGALPAPGADRSLSGTAPRTPVEELLTGLVAELLGVDGIGVERNLFDVGLDSMKSVRLVSRARRAGLPISIGDVFLHQSIAGLAEGRRIHTSAAVMADAIGAIQAETDPFAVLLPIQPNGTRPPLFCLHSGVGFSLPYLGLVPYLGPDQPIYGIQAPCVVGDAPLPASVEATADEYLEIIRRVQPTGPYHLLGWSFGGTLAYEMAVRLRAAGDEVGVLAVLDAYPTFGVKDQRSEQDMYAWMLRGLGHGRTELPDRELTVHDVIDVLRAEGNPMAAMGEHRMLAMAALMRHHQVLKAEYEPGGTGGVMHLFVSETPLPDGQPVDKAPLWRSCFRGDLVVYQVPCGHDDMMNPEALRVIGPAVASMLDGRP